MEYRIDLKASEAVQAYTLQKANAAKTKQKKILNKKYWV